MQKRVSAQRKLKGHFHLGFIRLFGTFEFLELLLGLVFRVTRSFDGQETISSIGGHEKERRTAHAD